VLTLGGLALPPGDADPATLLCAPAVALLDQCVRQLQYGFRLDIGDAASAAHAAAICRALEGSPLAIELASARVPLLGLAGVEAALHEATAHLDLRGSERRDLLPRQRSLRAAVERSCSLLRPAPQRVFRQFVVFAGSASLELTEAVLCGPDLDRWALLQAMDDLVARSLPVVAGDVPPRYRLLQAPLALARETEADLDNARAAMDWSLANDGGLAVELARSLGIALTTHHLAKMMRLYAATEPLLPRARDDGVRLQWLVGAGAILNMREPAHALRVLNQAIRLARAQGDSQALARALCLVATNRDPQAAALKDGALAEAVRLGRELAARWLGSRNMRALASARLDLANALLACDDAAAARALAVEAWPTAGSWLLQP
jgi:hypothetical protein